MKTTPWHGSKLYNFLLTKLKRNIFKKKYIFKKGNVKIQLNVDL